MKLNWKKHLKNRILTFVRKNKYATVLLIIALVGAGAYVQYSSSKKPSIDKKDVAVIVQEVSKLMVLPVGEAPSMFEIADPSFLSSKEPFFVGAEKGDVLLVYQKTGKAIIYSRSRNVIVNAGPLVNAK